MRPTSRSPDRRRRRGWSLPPLLAAALLGVLPAAAARGAQTNGADRLPAGDGVLFRFAVCADPHLSQDVPGERRFRAVLAAIRELPERPDCLLILGDIAPTGTDTTAIAEARQLLPTHVVWGNNDLGPVRDVLRREFDADFKGRDFYAFEHKGCLFIALCDAIPIDHIGHLSSDFYKGAGQVTWLSNLLAARAGKPGHVFIFGHIPPNATLDDANMLLAVNDQKFLRELVLQYRPAALFFGHMHNAFEFQWGPTPIFILPSTCWNFEARPTGFMEVTVRAKGIETRFIAVPQPSKDQPQPRERGP
jgi:Icc-related predicted phosphoesterase